ncbi:unnamed protein product, partial [marine sediment metagenome]
VKLFIVGTSLILLGIIFTMIMNAIPRPTNYGSEEYYAYFDTMRGLSNARGFFVQSGVLGIIVSIFLGAVGDRGVSDMTKRGMMVALGLCVLGLVALMIFGTIAVY